MAAAAAADVLPEPPAWLKQWSKTRAGPDMTYTMPMYNPATRRPERRVIVCRGGFIVSNTPAPAADASATAATTAVSAEVAVGAKRKVEDAQCAGKRQKAEAVVCPVLDPAVVALGVDVMSVIYAYWGGSAQLAYLTPWQMVNGDHTLVSAASASIRSLPGDFFGLHDVVVVDSGPLDEPLVGADGKRCEVRVGHVIPRDDHEIVVIPPIDDHERQKELVCFGRPRVPDHRCVGWYCGALWMQGSRGPDVRVTTSAGRLRQITVEFRL